MKCSALPMLLLSMVVLAATRDVSAAEDSSDRSWDCMILDRQLSPEFKGSFASIPDSRLDDHGKTGITEIRGDLAAATFKDVLEGEVNIGASLDLSFLSSSAGVGLPGQLGALALEADGRWHYIDNWGLLVNASPGIYSDLEDLSGDIFFLPFAGRIVKSFAPNLSAAAGLAVRPGWELALVPILGLAWAPVQGTRLDLGIPESRITYVVIDDLTIMGGIKWDSTTYALDESGADARDKITLDDLRITAGAMYAISEELSLTAEIGQAISRNIEFDRSVEGIDNEIDVDSATFVRVGLVGPF